MAKWIIIVCLTTIFLLLFRKKRPKGGIAPCKTKLHFEEDVMGKTKVVLRQSKTNEDTMGQIFKPNEKPDNFAFDDENKAENEPLKISVPLEYEIGNPDENLDEETEELRLLADGEANFASGASFEDLEHSYDVLRQRKTSEDDERKVAEILRNEGGTDIFRQMVAQVPQGVERVSSIMDKYFSPKSENVNSAKNKDYSDFDVANIL